MKQAAFPELYGLPPPKVWKRVRETSVQNYEIVREHAKGREAIVCRWLAHFWNAHQWSPSSGSLAVWVKLRHREEVLGWSWEKIILFVRRGLSDGQAHRIVEATGRRTVWRGRPCETWRVVERGT